MLDGRRLVVAAAEVVTVLATTVPAVAAATPSHAVVTVRPTGMAGQDPHDQLLPRSSHGARAVSDLGGDLDLAAARNGMTTSRLATLLRTDSTAWLDQDGGLFYVEPAPVARTAQPATSAAPYALNQTFALHSLPGSTKTIFLDFDGQRIAGSIWNQNSSLPDGFYGAWTTDGDASTFMDSERAAIQSIWQRVAEDYAPFDVDVTTEDPGSQALTRMAPTDETYGVRALITPSEPARTAVCGGGCGGVAYVGTFDATSTTLDYVQPAWIFPQGLGPNSPKFMADAISHELGHTLGLGHDGTSTSGYYAGQGSWAPIMGVGYGHPITQFSNGDYADANNLQDDYTVIRSNGLENRADEAGSTISTATPLVGTRAHGAITDPLDQDFYVVSRACSTPFAAAAVPAPTAPNLDIELTLLDSAGNAVERSNPPSGGSGDLATGMSASVGDHSGPGQYYLQVDGVGQGDRATTGYSDYGSLGAYTLTVTNACTLIPGAPSEPADLTVDSDSWKGSATLAWDPPSSDGGAAVSGYAVTRDGVVVADLDSAGRSYVFTGLARGAATTLGVRAVNANGNGLAGSKVTRLAPLPSPPASVRSIRSNHRVTMRWSRPVNAARAMVTGYVVRKYAADGSLLATRRLDQQARSFTWNRLVNGRPYRFRVGALSGAFPGRTASSGPVTPATRPWQPRLGHASVQAFRFASLVGVSWSAPRWDGGSRVTSYVVRAIRLGPSGHPVQVVRSSHLRPWHRYYALRVRHLGDRPSRWSFQVRAVNAMGVSAETRRSKPVWVH